MLLTVPVIAIFTKFDGLVNKAYGVLKRKGLTRSAAKIQALGHAIVDFENIYLGGIYDYRYPPKSHLYLEGKLVLLQCS